MLGDEGQLEKFLQFFKQGTSLSYQKGEYIIRPGESPSHIFYIESGLVKAFNISKYGEENLLVVRRPHEMFPIIWALKGRERHIIYQALAPTTVLRVDRKTFTQYLESNPKAMYPLLDLLIEQYQMHSERILNLEYRSVRERLISFLITMSNRFGKQDGDAVIIDVPLKQQDIASSINASRETTSRELSILERKGLLSTRQAYITLKDVEALKKLL